MARYTKYRNYSEPKRFKEDSYIEFKIGKEPVRFFLTLEAIKLGFGMFFFVVFFCFWLYLYFGLENSFGALRKAFPMDDYKNIEQKTSELTKTTEEEKEHFKLISTPYSPMDKRENTTLEVVSMEVEKAN